ncbi:hypothetical protein EYV94_08905 [Puteibacter caeruleilacunae]|nr:hypothetical protein EYV94_08905 [Puteibacter caeruleilacunae]
MLKQAFSRTQIVKTISLVLFSISCIIPTFMGADTIGAETIVSGWKGIIFSMPFLTLGWLANISYIAALLSSKKKAQHILSGATLILAMFAFDISAIPSGNGDEMIQVFPGVGFFFWILSFVTLFFYYRSSRVEAISHGRELLNKKRKHAAA